MTTFHVAGFPRVGAKRELKFAQERYWRGEIAEQDLLEIAQNYVKLTGNTKQQPMRTSWQSPISHSTIIFWICK